MANMMMDEGVGGYNGIWINEEDPKCIQVIDR